MPFKQTARMLMLVLVMALLVSCSGVIVSLTTEQEIHKFLDSYEVAWSKLSRADLEDHIEDSETKYRITHPDFVALAAMYQFPYNTGLDDDGNPTTSDENRWHVAQALLFSLFIKDVHTLKLLERDIQIDSTKTSAIVNVTRTITATLTNQDGVDYQESQQAAWIMELKKISNKWKIVGEY